MSPKSTVVLWKEIHEIADSVCTHFGWSYGKIRPETRNRVRYYGECFACQKCTNAPHIDEANCSEKILYLRVHQLNNPKKALAVQTILRTLAHELAHIGVWGHGADHRRVERAIQDYMSELGYGL